MFLGNRRYENSWGRVGSPVRGAFCHKLHGFYGNQMDKAIVQLREQGKTEQLEPAATICSSCIELHACFCGKIKNSINFKKKHKNLLKNSSNRSIMLSYTIEIN